MIISLLLFFYSGTNYKDYHKVPQIALVGCKCMCCSLVLFCFDKKTFFIYHCVQMCYDVSYKGVKYFIDF